ncbi:MAG TPA: pilus assembly PilX N-terminal domain-containing protein [Gemmatimonadales bacterium]|nr:pilus assembly PilX N-terminal domain-containing protein [Gemmatimonadales bacterium]
MNLLPDRRGMALALTLIALVIVGVLVAGALFSGLAEQRMAENTRFWLQAFGVAEGGAYGALSRWAATGGIYTARRAYPLDSAAPLTSDPGSAYSGIAYRLNSTLYLLDVTGRAGASGISQRVGLLVRIDSAGTATPSRSRGWVQLH